MTDQHEDWVRRQQQELGVRDTDALMTLWLERQNGSLAAEGVEAIRRLLLDRVGFLPPDPVGAKAPLALRAQTRLVERSDRDSFVSPKRLRQFSTAVQVFSWVYLASGLIAAGLQALQAFTASAWGAPDFTVVTFLLTILRAVFFFLVLQVMALGIADRKPRST